MTDSTAERRSGWARATKILIAIGILSLGFGIVFATLNRMRQTSGRLPCPSNLRQIGQAIAIYANGHGGQFPESLEVLIGEDSLPSKALVCPSSGDKPAAGDTTEEVRAALRGAGGGAHLSYVYIGAGLTSHADSGVVVAYDRPGNHGGDGCNALMGDGSVNWFPMRSMQYVLDEVAAGRLPVRRRGHAGTTQPATGTAPGQ